MSSTKRERGILFVISAPSGSGKSTLAARLVEADPDLDFSVSYTTRPRRDGEKDGRDYHFVDDARFDTMVADDAFLEWATVFRQRYGTGRDWIERALAEGRDLLLDIDVQGARQVRDRAGEAVFLFVLPPDYPTLESRLRARGSDDEAQIAHRLSMARREVEEYSRYDYVVVNDDLEGATATLRSIVVAERSRATRRGHEAKRILSTFPTERES
jgi:guanylate kinase